MNLPRKFMKMLQINMKKMNSVYLKNHKFNTPLKKMWKYFVIYFKIIELRFIITFMNYLVQNRDKSLFWKHLIFLWLWELVFIMLIFYFTKLLVIRKNCLIKRILTEKFKINWLDFGLLKKIRTYKILRSPQLELASVIL